MCKYVIRMSSEIRKDFKEWKTRNVFFFGFVRACTSAFSHVRVKLENEKNVQNTVTHSGQI